jgi:hypothetical protein
LANGSAARRELRADRPESVRQPYLKVRRRSSRSSGTGARWPEPCCRPRYRR